MSADRDDPGAGPDASRVSRSYRHELRLLSPEETMTYHRWRRGALMFYAAIAVVLGGLVVTGSSSLPALEKGVAHAQLAAGGK